MTATTYTPTPEALALMDEARCICDGEGITSSSPADQVVRFISPIVRDYGATIEIIGAWTWITFSGKPDDWTRALLKAAGFRWNMKRKCWQHSGGIVRPFHRKADKPGLISKYGVSIYQAGE